jgi:hypothetical protein
MPGPKGIFMKVPEPSKAERIDVRNLKSCDEIDRLTDVPFTTAIAPPRPQRRGCAGQTK